MDSLWKYSELIMVIIMELFQTHYGLIMELFQTHYGLIIELVRTHYGLIMELVRTHYGLIMESLAAETNGLTMDSLWTHYGMCSPMSCLILFTVDLHFQTLTQYPPPILS